MTEWKDATSYSQGDKARVPRVWRYVGKGFHIAVHRLHGLDGWYLSCRELDIIDRQLAAEDPEDAKKEGETRAASILMEFAVRAVELARTLAPSSEVRDD